MSYLGSKSQAGVWQRIISQMPPHALYVEPFFGSGQIFWRKLPAARNVIIDADAGVIAKFNADRRRPSSEVALSDRLRILAPKMTLAATQVICGDAIHELAALKPTLEASKTVIYCDPPYVHSTRTSRHRYNHEMTDEQHAQLLTLLQTFKCYVLISGYPSKLYDSYLRGVWRQIYYQTRTRGRTVTECLWCNFPKPTELHDYRFIGQNFRERLTLKRFATRFLTRLDAMPPLKRNFVLSLVHQRQFQR